ncbi:hypothetical protein [Embleya sp. NBC_00896]|uniref:hypothetical protein n=1 Tax=Embleya sp. NBC_00896 TaxID=2975961 RepID=UPI002F91786F|nr:hypothetical protein OG928_48320 [Embleya sp. NBC_00896]
MLDIEADTPLDPREAQDAHHLLLLARTLGVDPVDLDDAVHDAAAHYASEECNASGAVDDDGAADAVYDAVGHAAADVDNAGLDRQVPYLVSQYGAARAERIIREAACEA